MSRVEENMIKLQTAYHYQTEMNKPKGTRVFCIIILTLN
jgi:hypothetical protein